MVVLALLQEGLCSLSHAAGASSFSCHSRLQEAARPPRVRLLRSSVSSLGPPPLLPLLLRLLLLVLVTPTATQADSRRWLPLLRPVSAACCCCSCCSKTRLCLSGGGSSPRWLRSWRAHLPSHRVKPTTQQLLLLLLLPLLLLLLLPLLL